MCIFIPTIIESVSFPSHNVRCISVHSLQKPYIGEKSITNASKPHNNVRAIASYDNIGTVAQNYCCCKYKLYTSVFSSGPPNKVEQNDSNSYNTDDQNEQEKEATQTSHYDSWQWTKTIIFSRGKRSSWWTTEVRLQC